jgi:AraC-like DNA-binding protein
MLAAGLLRGEVTLEAVARALGVSTRSLQRRLAQAGTSFQAELDAVRRALAQRLLVEPGASVKAVAYSLGFSQVPAFTRAFRRWTGTAPHAFMRAGHGGRTGG